MPGLAASPLIFEWIQLPKNKFECYYLDWQIPLKNESIEAYAKRMAHKINHKEAVLIGVSFGGVVVQEMAEFLDLRKVIIISSVKSRLEMPISMLFAKKSKIYKLLPTQWAENLSFFSKYSFGNTIKHRLKLYEKYLSIRDKGYLDWAIEQMMQWKRIEIDQNVIHIHGDLDAVFPIKNIDKCIVIKGGTHIMILNKYRWFNANLPKIILE